MRFIAKSRWMVLSVLSMLLLGSVAASARDADALRKEFLKWKFGMFIHFNMSTFVPGGWSNGKEDPAKFNPENLDIGQWADAAKSAKMKYAILTIKHTGGWCLWPTKTTPHNVSMFKKYKGGKGDIVREFVDAFRKRGLKVGLYYCFPLWGDCWPNYTTLPLKNYATGKGDALSFIKAQFKELLTNYGKIDIVWIDQWGSTNGGLKQGDWAKIRDYIHGLQPNCVVVANTSKSLDISDIAGYEYPYSLMLPPPDNTVPSEVCDKLNSGWFANPGGPAIPVRSADYIVNKMLLPLVNRKSNYLLNCSPEKTGKLHPQTVALLKKIGSMWNPKDTTKYDKELYGIFDKPVKTVPNKKNLVFLCLAPEWTSKDQAAIATLLKTKNATATFFVDGKSAKTDTAALRNLAKAGNAIGNAIMAKEPLNKVTAMKIRDYVAPVQSQFQSTMAPVTVLLPESNYSWNIWTALNYYNLVVLEPGTIVSEKNAKKAGNTARNLKPGDIILLKYFSKAHTWLANFLDAAAAKGLRVSCVRKGFAVSTSKRLRAVVDAAGGEVVTGRE